MNRGGGLIYVFQQQYKYTFTPILTYIYDGSFMPLGIIKHLGI